MHGTGRTRCTWKRHRAEVSAALRMRTGRARMAILAPVVAHASSGAIELHIGHLAGGAILVRFPGFETGGPRFVHADAAVAVAVLRGVRRARHAAETRAMEDAGRIEDEMV